MCGRIDGDYMILPNDIKIHLVDKINCNDNHIYIECEWDFVRRNSVEIDEVEFKLYNIIFER